jgi:hypothetical protein
MNHLGESEERGLQGREAAGNRCGGGVGGEDGDGGGRGQDRDRAWEGADSHVYNVAKQAGHSSTVSLDINDLSVRSRDTVLSTMSEYIQ